MKQENKLYNVMFPIWMLLWFPQTWIITLPVNFIIDLFVLWVAMKRLQVSERKSKLKKAILKTWIAGFAADFVGGFLMLAVAFISDSAWWDEYMTSMIMANPFGSWCAFLWTTVCVFIAAVLIYFLNRKWCLKGLELTKEQMHKIALAMAVFTAPYLFYLPTIWFW